MKWRTITLSETALERISKDYWLPEEDLEQIRLALETIRLEKEYEAIPSVLQPDGSLKPSFIAKWKSQKKASRFIHNDAAGLTT